MYQQPYFTYGDIGFSSDIFPNVEYLSNNIAGFWSLNKNPSNWPIFTYDTDLQDKSIRAIVAKKQQRCSQLRVSVRHGRAIEFVSDLLSSATDCPISVIILAKEMQKMSGRELVQ